MNPEISFCPLFPPYFELFLEGSLQYLCALQGFYSGSLGRVFHNIYISYEPLFTSYWMQAALKEIQPNSFRSWIGE